MDNPDSAMTLCVWRRLDMPPDVALARDRIILVCKVKSDSPI